MRWALQFILSHSIFIALCAAALSFQTLQLLSHPVNFYRLGFIFFATVASYNAYWMVSRWAFSSRSSLTNLLTGSRSSLVVMVIAAAGLLICMTRIHLVIYNTIITFLLLSLYAIPLLPFKSLHFTRKAGFLKTTVLAFAWTMVTTLIPLQVSLAALSLQGVVVFLNRLFLMLMLCVIFDKRDAAVDKIRGLQSLATLMTPRLLHIVFTVMWLAYCYTCYVLYLLHIDGYFVWALAIAGSCTLGVYMAALQKRGYLFYYFLVDGLMFLSAVCTGVADYFFR